MISLEFVTITLLVVGVLIVAVTYISLKKAINSKEYIGSKFSNDDFEQFSEELNQTAEDIYKELDDKYKEILVIYNLIEKKHQELKNNKTTYQDFDLVSQNFGNIKKHEIKNKNYETMKIKAVNNHLRAKEPLIENNNSDIVALKVLNDKIKSEKSKILPSKHEDVKILLDRGFNVEQIAKELSIGVGEVQLIKELLKVKNE